MLYQSVKKHDTIQLFFLFSGGVVIYFDRIEVVNILEASSGELILPFTL